MVSGSVFSEQKGGVAIVELCEPESRNALSASIKASLERIIPALVDDVAVRAILLTGRGKTFCAGGDLSSLTKPQQPVQARKRLARSYGWIEKLVSCEKPVIAAVNGPAVGAGFGIAMLADIVLISEKTWFMSGFGAIGVAADFGLGRSLPRAIGAMRAKDILLTGRKVEAEEALAIGLASRLLPSDRLRTDAELLAQSLADGATVGLGLTKMLIEAGFRDDISSYLQREGFAQSVAFTTHDHREGLGAIGEKRKPVFTGE